MCLPMTANAAGRLAGCLACCLGLLAAPAESAPAKAPPAEQPSPQKQSPYRPTALSDKARMFYQTASGIDQLQVSRTASGSLIRFSYRVTDPQRAKTLGEKEATPYLVDPQRGVILQVPVMDKIGALRQAGAPQAGKEYWVLFSNKGDVVKAGDRVDVLIGTFHADGLAVE